MVHNGHISNASTLKAEHEKLGIEYLSVQPGGEFNDSEALLYDLALYLEGKQTELKAKGSIAFIATGKEGDKLWFGRGSNPLNINLTTDGLTLSSEGEGKPATQHTLYEFDRERKVFVTKELDIGTKWSSSSNYSHSGTYSDYNYQDRDINNYAHWFSRESERTIDIVNRYTDDDLDYTVSADGRKFSVQQMEDGNRNPDSADARMETYHLMDYYENAQDALAFVRKLQDKQEERVLSTDLMVDEMGDYTLYETDFYKNAVDLYDHYQEMVNFIEDLTADGAWGWSDEPSDEQQTLLISSITG